jgi:hypothetical protein
VRGREWGGKGGNGGEEMTQTLYAHVNKKKKKGGKKKTQKNKTTTSTNNLEKKKKSWKL